MNTDAFTKMFDHLIDNWCERKELGPLRLILNGRASLNGLTDGYEECLYELQTNVSTSSKQFVLSTAKT